MQKNLKVWDILIYSIKNAFFYFSLILFSEEIASISNHSHFMEVGIIVYFYMLKEPVSRCKDGRMVAFLWQPILC